MFSGVVIRSANDINHGVKPLDDLFVEPSVYTSSQTADIILPESGRSVATVATQSDFVTPQKQGTSDCDCIKKTIRFVIYWLYYLSSTLKYILESLECNRNPLLLIETLIKPNNR